MGKAEQNMKTDIKLPQLQIQSIYFKKKSQFCFPIQCHLAQELSCTVLLLFFPLCCYGFHCLCAIIGF